VKHGRQRRDFRIGLIEGRGILAGRNKIDGRRDVIFGGRRQDENERPIGDDGT
jgi:hypothetical protein